MGLVHKENQQSLNKLSGSKTILHKIPCFYMNAHQFKRKFPEFCVRIQNEQPMLIAITEVKPKHSIDKLFPAEFSIEHIGDYDSLLHRNITNDTGRGLLIYAHKSLKAKEVEMLTDFQESLFAEIKLNNTDKLLVGCIYRSESGSDDNNNKLRLLIREAVSKKYSHVLLMGDFNYPDIDWTNWTTKSESTESQEFKFIECIRDSFLFQHITNPTRVRGSDTPNVLDLIFTNESNMASNIEYQSPLGKSDHSVLKFDFNCYTVIQNYSRKKVYYNKADYNTIREALHKIEWEENL